MGLGRLGDSLLAQGRHVAVVVEGDVDPILVWLVLDVGQPRVLLFAFDEGHAPRLPRALPLELLAVYGEQTPERLARFEVEHEDVLPRAPRDERPAVGVEGDAVVEG